MAADFQNQFQEAMREAEMADLKKQVDDIATDIKQYDPLKDVRSDLENTGKDIQASLESPALMTAGDADAAGTGPIAPETVEASAPELPVPVTSAAPGENDAIAAATGPVAPEPADDGALPATTRQAG